MIVLLDTSALIEIIDLDARHHVSAVETFQRTCATDRLVTHNYVVTEAVSLVHRRVGPEAVRRLLDLVALTEVFWVDRSTHDAASAALLAARSRKVSFVDWVSFEVMRRRQISTAFAFDRDFKVQGFEVIP